MLAEILEFKTSIAEMEKNISDLKTTHGIDILEEQVKKDKERFKEMLLEHYEAGNTQEGNIIIVNTGRKDRDVYVDEFKKDHPDIFMECIKVKLTDARKILTARLVEEGFNKTEAKEQMDEYFDSISEISQQKQLDIMTVGSAD